MNDEKLTLEKELQRAMKQAKQYDTTSDEYKACMDNIKTLTESIKNMQSTKVNKNTVVSGVLSITQFTIATLLSAGGIVVFNQVKDSINRSRFNTDLS